MFIQLAGSRRSWQKPGGAIISLVMILSMLILSFILYFKFRISGRYLLSEESGYLLFIFGKEDFNEADKKFSDLRNVCGFGDCAAHGVPYDSGCGKGFPAYAYSGAAVRLLCGPVYGLGCGILAPLLSIFLRECRLLRCCPACFVSWRPMGCCPAYSSE